MIFLKSQHEIDLMRKANQIVSEALSLIEEKICEGVTTEYLDKICEDYILSQHAEPAFKGYKGYPSTVCVSINDEIVHGIPDSKRKIRTGDVVSCDIGAKYKGYYGDSAYTFAVGDISSEAEKLLSVTEKALYKGIEMARPGNRLYDIGHSIQTFVESEGLNVVKVFVGHGIGRHLHEDPQIPNYGPAGRGVKLREGMVLAIEPMVNIGTDEVEIMNDGWTAVTKDGSLSAHFEHSIAVRNGEPEILSIRGKALFKNK